MNVSGIIKGGLLAGLVINIGEIILNRFIVADSWEGVAAFLGYEQSGIDVAMPILMGFLMGIAGVWLYAIARPRLGAGPETAFKIGLVAWFFAWFWQNVSFMTRGDLFPMELLLISTVWTLIETPLAVIAGAWLYTEVESHAKSEEQDPIAEAAA